MKIELDKESRKALLTAIVAVAGTLFFVHGARGIAAFGQGPVDYAAIHLLLEMFAIAIAMMVLFVAWYGLAKREILGANAMVACFLVVCVADIGHAVFFEGMPSLIVEPGANRSIYFWMVGRFFECLAIISLTRTARLPGSRALWLLAGVSAASLFVAIGLQPTTELPTLFVPGKGLTAVKSDFELGLFVANILLSVRIYWRSRAGGSNPMRLLAWSCLLIAISCLMFASYLLTDDVVNLAGHILRIAGYAFLLVYTLHSGISEPYAELAMSTQALTAAEEDLRALLEQLPVGIARVDNSGRYLYVNNIHAASLKRPPEQIVGRSIDEIINEPNLSQAKHHLALAFRGETSDFSLSFATRDGTPGYLHARVVPDRARGGDASGALAIFLDVTETENARALANESMREVADLKAALDAHAIVAVTDAKGVITRVNDKFCSISQYSRDELIGSTHRIINSGKHDRAFFRGLWQTISRGQVWNGEICNKAKDGSLYWVHTTIVPLIGPDGLPEQYIAIRADITKRVEAEQEAIRMALHDVLTGLPNRRKLVERLERVVDDCRRTSSYAAMILLDLDNFKEINDTLGHLQGDQLLKQVGNRLLRSARADDAVARFGGDEFALLMPELGADSRAAVEAANAMAEGVREALAKHYVLADQDVSVTASLGVVLFAKDSPTSDELVKQADLALYKSKERGRNTVSFFDPVMQADLMSRAELLRDLRSAIDRKELELHYQAVVDRNRQVLGVEALLRWNHPVKGRIPPNVFIPLAETHGLIVEIGRWVLEEACQQLAAWSTDPVKSRWTVAVNVSARQLHEPDFVPKVERALRASGARPTHLRLEITESMLQDDLETTIGKMASLRSIGVRFALDDFGTGYSSLSYLKRMPIDQLKIDRSFVSDVPADPNSVAIARTILSLAASLEVGVVAEGVENEEQLTFLLQHGCESFQGFLFSRPGPAAQFG